MGVQNTAAALLLSFAMAGGNASATEDSAVCCSHSVTADNTNVRINFDTGDGDQFEFSLALEDVRWAWAELEHFLLGFKGIDSLTFFNGVDIASLDEEEVQNLLDVLMEVVVGIYTPTGRGIGNTNSCQL